MTSGYYDITSKVLGKGHHGLVKLARHCLSGEPTALKVIEKSRLNCYSLQQLGTEIRILFTLSEYEHPNILKLYQTIDTQDKLFLVTEYCGPNACDLHDYLLSSRNGLSENEARIFFIQICSAISYCHSMGIVHRDLKPENILVADVRQMFYKKRYPLLKLIDFGFANQWKPQEKMRTSCGTLAYSAPELLLGEPYDGTKVDVWGLGILLYILIYGSNPFMQINDSETLTKILDCSYTIPKVTSISDEAIDLIKSIIKKNPNSRLSINQILKHVWFDKLDDNLFTFDNNNHCINLQSGGDIISKNTTKLSSMVPPLPSINECGPLKSEDDKKFELVDRVRPINWRTRSLSITKNSLKENTISQTKSSINLSLSYEKCQNNELTSPRTNYIFHKLNYRPTSPDIRGSILSEEELKLHNQVLDEMFRLTKLIDSKSTIESSLKEARMAHRKFNEKSIGSSEPNRTSDISNRTNILKTLQHGLKHQSQYDDEELNYDSDKTSSIESKLSNDEYIYATYQLLRDRIIRVKYEKSSDLNVSTDIPTKAALIDAESTKTGLVAKKLLQPQHKLKDRFTSFFRSGSKSPNDLSQEVTVPSAGFQDIHHEAFSDHNVEHSAGRNFFGNNSRETLEKLKMSYALPLARKCSLVSEEGGYASDLAD